MVVWEFWALFLGPSLLWRLAAAASGDLPEIHKACVLAGCAGGEELGAKYFKCTGCDVQPPTTGVRGKQFVMASSDMLLRDGLWGVHKFVLPPNGGKAAIKIEWHVDKDALASDAEGTELAMHLGSCRSFGGKGREQVSVFKVAVAVNGSGMTDGTKPEKTWAGASMSDKYQGLAGAFKSKQGPVSVVKSAVLRKQRWHIAPGEGFSTLVERQTVPLGEPLSLKEHSDGHVFCLDTKRKCDLNGWKVRFIYYCDYLDDAKVDGAARERERKKLVKAGVKAAADALERAQLEETARKLLAAQQELAAREAAERDAAAEAAAQAEMQQLAQQQASMQGSAGGSVQQPSAPAQSSGQQAVGSMTGVRPAPPVTRQPMASLRGSQRPIVGSVAGVPLGGAGGPTNSLGPAPLLELVHSVTGQLVDPNAEASMAAAPSEGSIAAGHAAMPAVNGSLASVAALFGSMQTPNGLQSLTGGTSVSGLKSMMGHPVSIVGAPVRASG